MIKKNDIKFPMNQMTEDNMFQSKIMSEIEHTKICSKFIETEIESIRKTLETQKKINHLKIELEKHEKALNKS